jgi:NHL repeat
VDSSEKRLRSELAGMTDQIEGQADEAFGDLTQKKDLKAKGTAKWVPRPTDKGRRNVILMVSLVTLLTVVFAGLTSSPASATVAGTLTVLAGGPGGSATPSPPSDSQIGTTNGIAVDAGGNVYIADRSDDLFEKVTAQGQLSVIAGSLTLSPCGTPVIGSPATDTGFCNPDGIAVDAKGDVFLTDSHYNAVYEISEATGDLSVVPGSTTAITPSGVALDSAGNLFVSFSSQVEEITTSGSSRIIAGNGTFGATVAGPATATALAEPNQVAVDNMGNVYIADPYNGLVDEVNPAGQLSIVAGDVGGSTPATAYSFGPQQGDGPNGVAVDPQGNVFIADSDHCTVDRVTPAGAITVVAGTSCGSPSVTSGMAATSQVLYGPQNVAFDTAGDLLIGDTDFSTGSLVEQVADLSAPDTPQPGSPSLSGRSIIFPWTAVSGATTYSVTIYIDGIAQDPITGLSGSGYVLSNPVVGDTYWFTVAAVGPGGDTPFSVRSPSVTVPSSSTGYWTVAGDGGVFSFGPSFFGSTGGLKLNQPVFAITSTVDGKGYWFVARDGGVFTYGDGLFFGSVPALGIHVSNIVGMAADTATGGYWLVGSDGGVYAFGAPFDGSVPVLGQHLSNIVGMAATADGGGYYLVSSTGAVYSFGDATNQGGADTLAHVNAAIVGISVDSATGGYWEAGSDGGVYAFGAPFEGSAGGTKLDAPVVGISATTNSSGYYLVASDGGVFSYNAPFLGSMGGEHLNSPMVGITAAP